MTLHTLELAALNDIAKASGIPETKFNEVIDERLSFAENKRLLREHLRAEDKSVDMKAEMVAEKELAPKLAEAAKEEVEKKEKHRYDSVAERKAEVMTAINSRRDEIMKEIDDYNPHMRPVTYSTLFSVMNAKQGSQKTNVINKGKQGTGKSRGTSELIKRLEIPDAVIITGFMTPKKLYETLRHHFASTICFDEAEQIFNDEMSLFILRPAMFGGEVSWLTSRGETMDSFKFEGTIIANMNHFAVKEAAAAPLFDRTLYNETNLTTTQVLDKIKSADTYKMKDDIWNLIRDRVTLIRTDGTAKLTDDEDAYILAYICEVAAQASVFNKSLSARARSRAYLVARCLKSLFNSFDDKVKELYKELVKPYIAMDDADDICVKILAKNGDVTRLELAEIISEQKSISVRQASRLIKASIERGTLIGINRTKVAIVGSAAAKAAESKEASA